MNLSKLLDLREIGVGCLTLGQYMQPTRRHLKVRTYHLDSLHFRFLLQFDNDVPKVDVDCICRHSALTCDFIVFVLHICYSFLCLCQSCGCWRHYVFDLSACLYLPNIH